MQPSDLSERDRQRFYGKLEQRGPDECWPWRGTIASNSYGLFDIGPRANHRKLGAHRVAWMLANDQHVPDRSRSHMCHRCDNPRCCNPAHLFLGTASENIKDAVAKGYRPFWSTGGATGIKNHRAKLTDDDVRNIRRQVAEGRKQRDIGKDFNIPQSSVWAIAHRRGWKHVA
jgi:hypothetical protein